MKPGDERDQNATGNRATRNQASTLFGALAGAAAAAPT